MIQDPSIEFAIELAELLSKQDAVFPLASHVPDYALLESLGTAAEKVENAAVAHHSDPAVALLVQELRLVMRDVRLAIGAATAAHPGDGLDPTLLFPAISEAINDILRAIRHHD